MLQFDCEYLQINARNWCFVKLRNSTSNKWLLECFFLLCLASKRFAFLIVQLIILYSAHSLRTKVFIECSDKTVKFITSQLRACENYK